MLFGRPVFPSLSSSFLAVASQPTRKVRRPIFPVVSPSLFLALPILVFIGDFNGDGKPDLAYIEIISSSQSSLGILLNFGSSTPTTVTTPLCVAGASQPSFADVNNDKKLDLVYSCNGFLTIQLGNGDGTFQAPAYFGKYTGTLVFADLNGDRYLDIAALIPNANAPPQLAVFLNQGATAPGMFSSPTLYAAPSGLLACRPAISTEMANRTWSQPFTPLVHRGPDCIYRIFHHLRERGRHAERCRRHDRWLPSTASLPATLMVTESPILRSCRCLPLNTLFTTVQIFLGSNSGTIQPGRGATGGGQFRPATNSRRADGRGCSHQRRESRSCGPLPIS